MRIPHFAIATLACALAAAAGCARGGGRESAATEVVAASETALPTDPRDPAWERAAVFTAPLVPQDMVEPRLTSPSTREIQVRALTDGRRVAFRLDWTDATRDDRPATGSFSDACAVQLPAQVESDVPAPQMGEPGRAVEVSYWRASWQAVVEGRPDTIDAIHPNAVVDSYPFEAPPLKPGSPEQRAMADRYAPARALGNAMAGPRTRPVEDLVAEGPGTLRPAPARSEGSGRRSDDGWSVLLARPLPEGMAPGRRGQVAFAVWDGAREEAGARKMRSNWITFTVEGAEQ
jgi:DMSO reductase family type II enzyme heme b subunit